MASAARNEQIEKAHTPEETKLLEDHKAKNLKKMNKKAKEKSTRQRKRHKQRQRRFYNKEAREERMLNRALNYKSKRF
jgi:hypothetical protein